MNALSDKRLDLDETSVHTCFDPLVEITHIVELLKLISEQLLAYSRQYEVPWLGAKRTNKMCKVKSKTRKQKRASPDVSDVTFQLLRVTPVINKK